MSNKPEDTAAGCGLLVLLVVGSMIALKGCGPSAEERDKIRADSDKRVRATYAYLMSQEFVKQRLVSTGSAKFSWSTPYDTITELGGNKYKVRHYCDSQNAFGALVRTNYSCTMEKLSGDKWACHDLIMTQRR